MLVYTGEKLKKDMTVIGTVKVRLFAATDAVDTDFTAKLVDVHPDGYAQNILDRIIRAELRRSSKLPPSAIVPGQVYQYELELGHTANVFKAGHRVRLEVSSSNFPHYARNLNTGESTTEARIEIANQTIVHDARHQSVLELPVVPYGLTGDQHAQRAEGRGAPGRGPGPRR